MVDCLGWLCCLAVWLLTDVHFFSFNLRLTGVKNEVYNLIVYIYSPRSLVNHRVENRKIVIK